MTTWLVLWMLACFGVSITVARRVTKLQLAGLYVLAGVLIFIAIQLQ